MGYNGDRNETFGVCVSMAKFIGRKLELERLLELTKKKTASFVVVRGRRRIGKSRLVEEFSKNFDNFYAFSGLPPDKNTTTAHQVEEFSRQISREFNTARAKFEDWSDAFWAIGERVQSGKTLVLFDEISWMGSKVLTFLGKIKNLWDDHLKKNDKLIFVICGSASSWIEKNILSSTGFVGRVSYTLCLNELPLADCAEFWPENVSAYEKFKVLSVTGGVPKYLEEILPHKSAEENILRLCFREGGFLVNEFERIFADIFIRNSDYYKKIIRSLLAGQKEQKEICDDLGIKRHGRISEYLDELYLAGFVTPDYNWNLKTGADSKVRKYRLSDNYMRFYLRYVETNLNNIKRNSFSLGSLTSLSQWPVVMGLQFENLVLNNRLKVWQQLGINPANIIQDNPFFQKRLSNQDGCQIDYLIETKFNTLYVCEIKFSKNPVGVDVIKEVQQKIDKLKKPRGFSCRPVLIHVNGVTSDLLEADYFAEIIDFSELLQSS